MAGQDLLALEFEVHRPHLRAVAYRILGSASDADDVVQETWLRLSRSDVSDVLNLRAWLTTVASRVALNLLDSRAARREDASAEVPEPSSSSSGTAAAAGGPAAAPAPGPEDEALLGDEVSAALQVVVRTLEPRERLAFVLHDLFAVPFDEIGLVIGATSAAARQLASRARRRVRAAADGGGADGAGGAGGADGTDGAGGADGTTSALGLALAAREERHREVVAAFFAAAREARFAALLELLAPDVVMRADAVAARMGADHVSAGADAVAQWIAGRARGAAPALVGCEPGAAWVVNGAVRVAFGFTITGAGRITAIDLIGNPATLAELSVELS